MQKLIKSSGLTIKQFSEQYEIPYNTVRQWANGKRQAPEYIKNLIYKCGLSYFEGYNKGSKDSAKKILKFAKNFNEYEKEEFIEKLKKIVNEYEIEV